MNLRGKSGYVALLLFLGLPYVADIHVVLARPTDKSTYKDEVKLRAEERVKRECYVTRRR